MTAAVESPEVARAVASAMRAQDALARRRPVEALAAASEAAGLFRAALGPASADLAYALILQSRSHSLAGEEAAALTAA